MTSGRKTPTRLDADGEMEKQCGKCGEWWPLTDEFWIGSRGKLYSPCKACYDEHRQQKYQESRLSEAGSRSFNAKTQRREEGKGKAMSEEPIVISESGLRVLRSLQRRDEWQPTDAHARTLSALESKGLVKRQHTPEGAQIMLTPDGEYAKSHHVIVGTPAYTALLKRRSTSEDEKPATNLRKEKPFAEPTDEELMAALQPTQEGAEARIGEKLGSTAPHDPDRQGNDKGNGVRERIKPFAPSGNKPPVTSLVNLPKREPGEPRPPIASDPPPGGKAKDLTQRREDAKGQRDGCGDCDECVYREMVEMLAVKHPQIDEMVKLMQALRALREELKI